MLADILKKWQGIPAEAMEVYSDIFGLGSGQIQRSGEEKRAEPVGNPLLYYKNARAERGHYRILFEDDFQEALAEGQAADFAIINGLTYFGRRNRQAMASRCYALIFDLDGVTAETLNNLLSGAFKAGAYPIPSYIALSGHGVHIYYLLAEPIPLYPNIKIQLKSFKYALTEKLWNPFTSTLKEKQFQGINQGFRPIGGKTKIDGVRVQAYRMTTKRYTLAELGQFVPEAARVDEAKLWKEHRLTLAAAREKYPEWYQARIIDGTPAGHWVCKRALYDWWLRRIREGATFHHRYFAIMCLAIYAVKSGISEEELRRDALGLIPFMNNLSPEHPFTEKDVESALECYDSGYFTFPIEDIEKISGIPIPRNKRNGRPRDLHLKIARATLEVINANSDLSAQGRPPKLMEVLGWQAQHPDGTRAECVRETGYSWNTVRQYWSKTSPPWVVKPRNDAGHNTHTTT